MVGVAVLTLVLSVILYGTSSVGEATVAIGTLGLAVATVVLALATRGLAATTDEEMKLLRDQTGALKIQADIARSDAEERARAAFRAQAELVSAVMGPVDPPTTASDPTSGRTGIDLVNTSPSPVYGLVVAIVDIQGTGPHTIEEWLRWREKAMRQTPITTTNILPPGTFRIWIPGSGWQAPMGGRMGAEVAFTDRAGKHWIRRAHGQLEEIPTAPADYYKTLGFYGPHDFLPIQRV